MSDSGHRRYKQVDALYLMFYPLVQRMQVKSCYRCTDVMSCFRCEVQLVSTTNVDVMYSRCCRLNLGGHFNVQVCRYKDNILKLS